MAGGDSLELVIAEIGKSLTEVRDTFVLLGLFYTGKVTLKCLSTTLYGFKTYLISKMIRNDKWLRSQGEWAIITGCTRGIGLGYAKELAKRGFNLILIARNEELLKRISTSLEEKHNIKTIIICADLSQSSCFDSIEKVVLSKDIGVLINNVGVANELMFFHEIPSDLIERIIDTNTKPVTMMTRMVLPEMIRKNKGAIVNISSSSIDLPSVYVSVYASTKSFIQKFTQILQFEYRKTNIVFQCLMTNLVSTQATSKIKNPLRYSINGQQYAASAIQTIGYSNHTSGHWIHGLQIFLTALIPRFIFNPYVIHAMGVIKDKQMNNQNKDFDDIEIILNSD